VAALRALGRTRVVEQPVRRALEIMAEIGGEVGYLRPELCKLTTW
jgi:hypothetical protein